MARLAVDDWGESSSSSRSNAFSDERAIIFGVEETRDVHPRAISE